MSVSLGRTTRCRRRGSAYLVVLGSALIVSVIGLSSIMVVRIRHRTGETANDACQARLCAQSGVEAAVGATCVLPNWRSDWEDYTSEEGYGPLDVGRGQCTIFFTDEIDGDIDDDPDQPVRIAATGRVNKAAYRYSALAQPPALNCLKVAIHAISSFTVNYGQLLTVEGAPAFCQGSGGGATGLFDNNVGTVNGDVEANTVQNDGVITGTITETTCARELPDANTPSYYTSRATTITRTAIGGEVISGTILSQNRNPYGSENADGVYYINTEGRDLTIQNCRIQATLVVSLDSDDELYIKRGVYWEPYRSDYPALIVIGGYHVHIAIQYSLSEDYLNVNFNPTGMPYQGQTDWDEDDTYPGVIKGLIHVVTSTTTVKLEQSTRIEGVVLAECPVEVNDTVTVKHDLNLVVNPPKRYRSKRLSLVPGTWRRELVP